MVRKYGKGNWDDNKAGCHSSKFEQTKQMIFKTDDYPAALRATLGRALIRRILQKARKSCTVSGANERCAHASTCTKEHGVQHHATPGNARRIVGGDSERTGDSRAAWRFCADAANFID